MTDLGSMTIEEALVHFGTRGMKWGVRKGKSATGQSRFAGAKIQANNRTIKGRTKYMNSPLGKIPGYKNMQAKQISKLNDSNARVISGKAKVRDVLDVYSLTSITDLAFTKTPR